MQFETLKIQKDDGILIVILNRPDKLNAYTARMGVELTEIFESANIDDEVRVIIVTGEGRGFCAGADVSGGPDSFGKGALDTFGTGEDSRSDSRWVDAIYNCLKPSIAAINGPAIGVGFTMTLPMDIRICSSDAKFGPVFAKLGLFPEAGATWFLPRIVGTAQAFQWCLMGDILNADEAFRGRLVTEVTEPNALLNRAREIAGRIVKNTSPISVAVTRQLFQRCSNLDSPHDVLVIDAKLNREAGLSSDVREGVSAMIEKREPEFPGKVSSDLPHSFPWWD